MDRHPYPMTNQPGLDEYERLLTLLDERRFDEAQLRAQLLLEQGETALWVRAKTHNLLCWIFIEGLKRPSPEAVLHGEEAVRLAQQADDRSLHLQACCNLASAHYQVGDYNAAEQSYQVLLRELFQAPDLLPEGRALALQGLAQIDLVRGRREQALARLQQAEVLCQEEGNGHLLAEVYRRQAMVFLQLRQPDQAAEVLSRIDEQALAGGPRSLWWRTHLGFTRARLEVAFRRWGPARQLVQNTMALARELGDLPVLAECLCLLTTIEASQGQKGVYRQAQSAVTCAILSGRRDVVNDVRRRLRPYLATDL